MSEVLKHYQPSTKPGPAPTYPWAEWFDGETRRLKQGEDFNCSPQSLQDHIYKTARSFCKTCKIAFPKKKLTHCPNCKKPLGLKVSAFKEAGNSVVLKPS